ncbi:MAG: hypothetical protein DMD91_34290 [Candidatus Rokuibacteriota bacterium]|nr:MAG: hypothetical protein DMD91_34290 [Candidatus Rokubacteria bacterium]
MVHPGQRSGGERALLPRPARSRIPRAAGQLQHGVLPRERPRYPALRERKEKLYRTPQQDNRLHHSFTLSPEEWEKAVRLFHERGVQIEELTYREHGFFTGRELYFLDPSGNLLEVRDPTWKAGMATPALTDIVGGVGSRPREAA